MTVHHAEGSGLGGDPGEGEYTVGSLSEIQNAVEAFRQHVREWYAQRHYKQENPHLYFRGVPDETYELVPSIGRKCAEQEARKREKDVLKLLLSKLRSLYDDRQALGVQKQMAARFAELFSDLGPNDDVDSIPQDWQFPLLALAQHYRIPTRLLDWSECPNVAACFAVANKKEGTEEKCAALYVFHDRTAVSVAGGAILFPKEKRNINQVRPFRMYQDSIKYYELWRDVIGLDEAWHFWNQKAVLTVQPCITKRLDDQLGEASLSPDGNPRYQKLRRLTIPADRKKPIREELAKKGITYRGLFLGPFEKLCREVREAFSEPIEE